MTFGRNFYIKNTRTWNELSIPKGEYSNIIIASFGRIPNRINYGRNDSIFYLNNVSAKKAISNALRQIREEVTCRNDYIQLLQDYYEIMDKEDRGSDLYLIKFT